jgi:exodeoxyribonuclease V alpha subunit
MAKLLSALKEDARLILLGDRDQLASVEPGAVFGDLCAAGGDHVVILDKNFRFGEDSGIRALSDMVKEGDAAAAFDLLVSGRYNDIHWKDIPPPQYVREELKERTVKKYADAFTADDPYEAFKPYFEFRVLCALRKGPYGAETVNGLIEKALDSKGLIQRKGMFYKGLPVMVTVNDYQLRLYNGDIGVLLPDIEAGGALRVHFPAESGLFRKVLPARLPLWEKAYAMTVHKSQGSEFDEVLVVLPDRSSEVVTRELIYTAITRARGHVEIWGTRDAFIQAVSRKLARSSGLTDAPGAILFRGDLRKDPALITSFSRKCPVFGNSAGSAALPDTTRFVVSSTV